MNGVLVTVKDGIKMEKRTLYYGRYAFPDLCGVVSYVMLCYVVFYFHVVTYVLKIMGRVAVAM